MFEGLESIGGESGEEVFFCREVLIGGVGADTDGACNFSKRDLFGSSGFENGERGGDKGVAEVAVVIGFGAFGLRC